MPKGPQGQKRPADVIGAAIMTARIATGEIEETDPTSPAKAKAGRAAARRRAAALTAVTFGCNRSGADCAVLNAAQAALRPGW